MLPVGSVERREAAGSNLPEDPGAGERVRYPGEERTAGTIGASGGSRHERSAPSPAIKSPDPGDLTAIPRASRIHRLSIGP